MQVPRGPDFSLALISWLVVLTLMDEEITETLTQENATELHLI